MGGSTAVSLCLPAADFTPTTTQVDTATVPDAIAVFGCFAPDGPQHCSGLPVARYSPVQLARQVGAKWLLISQDREEHVTPAGTIQPFTWVVLRRQF